MTLSAKEIPKDAILIAIDGGGHRQRFVKTNKKAEILAESSVLYEKGMTEEDLNKASIEKVNKLIAKDRQLYGVTKGKLR